MERKILTIFAGRQRNLEILVKYLQIALKSNILTEVHFWNFCRNKEDEDYLASICNLKRTSSNFSGIYRYIFPVITNNSFDLFVEAPNDIHIKIDNNETSYEIVIGGWGNQMSVVRKNGMEVFSLNKPNIIKTGEKNKFTTQIIDGSLNVLQNDKMLFQVAIEENFKIKNVLFKTGHGSVANLNFFSQQHQNLFFMDPCEKTWKNYYEYYDKEEFKHDIIIKCDDDILFIDVPRLPSFFDFVREKKEIDIVFANIINNGVAAFYQQNKFKLIPKSLLELEYPAQGLNGSLWQSGDKAEILHKYFIENVDSFLKTSIKDDFIYIFSRFSINFFAIRGEKWNKIKDCYKDDELHLTVTFVQNERKMLNVLYPHLFVSHLSFYKQVETGIHVEQLQNKYDDLFYKMERIWSDE